jgi:repressor LexA
MLTPKQKMVLEYIQSEILTKGYSPSQKEIAEHFGFRSLGTVQNYLVRLEKNGFLEKEWNSKRGSKVIAPIPGIPPLETASTPPSSPVAHPLSLFRGQGRLSQPHPTQLPSVSLKLSGRVAAGRPIEYLENDEEITVPSHFFKTPETAHQKHFLLRVQGQSMIEDGILDGDLVIIREQKTASNGETAVAMIGNEATIKRFYKHKNKIELRPANENYESIYIDSLTDPKDFRIEGVMVGLIRKLAY